jgi:deoxyribonuclease-2
MDDWIARCFADTFGDKQPAHCVAYNDQVPASPVGLVDGAMDCGHTKGVVVWDDASDVMGWLIHSVPRWPASPTRPEPIPHAEREFGQSLAWVRWRRGALPVVMGQLALNQAHVYADRSAGAWVPMPHGSPPVDASTRVVQLGPGVAHVAKHGRWGKDLFEDALASGLDGCCAGGPCTAETWMRPLCAPTPRVRNVVHLRWPGGVVGDYGETQDHSKWAVSDAPDASDASDAPDEPWVFVGDINRMPSQHHRGGGGLVVRGDARLWRAFTDIILARSSFTEA